MMLEKWDAGELDFEPKCTKWTLRRQSLWMRGYLFVLKGRAVTEGIDLGDEGIY